MYFPRYRAGHNKRVVMMLLNPRQYFTVSGFLNWTYADATFLMPGAPVSGRYSSGIMLRMWAFKFLVSVSLPPSALC